MPFPTEMKFIRRTEDRLGILLPLSYVETMCEENGGGEQLPCEAIEYR